MIKMKLTFRSYAEAAIAMSALAAMGVQVKGASAIGTKVEPVEKQVVANIKADKAAKQEGVAQGQEQASKAPEAAAEATVTYLDVKTLAGNLAKTSDGRAKVVAIFAKHGAKVGTDLTPEQWPAVVAELKAAA